MKRLKRLFVLSLLTVTAVFTAGTNEANAASKLTPEHLYTWAKDNDTARLNKYKHYINIENQDKNTALCLAQQDQNRDAYALLLQFGASTKVPCHNDNDPVCAMIVGEKIKVSPAGMALIGAGAAAAGAYALLHDDDDKGCNVKNYPLAECPEHGHCSECKDKKRLDTCDEFWTPNADKTACIPADCPANQYTSCEDKADHITTATPTTSKSGDQQCYQCSYKCNETDNRYDNLGFCAAAHAGIVCELNENQCWYPARCDTAKGYYDTDADCRTGNFGYTCKIAANNCYEKDVCDVANGHHPDQTSCENANTGYHCTQQENLCWQPDFTLLTECPSGSHTALCETKTGVISTSNATGKSGPDDCLACDYKCDSANGWKQGTSAADCPLGRICSDISINDTNRGQTLTCYHDDGCPTDYTYTSQSTCEEGGYTCAESAAGSQCWKRTGNADCPDTHPNRTQCQTGTGYTNGQTQTQVGDAPCYNCNYQCDTANNWLSACPSGKVCSEITMPSGAKCYTPTGCDTSNGYFDNTNTCQNANPEHICTLDSTGCYVVGACDAAHGYYASDTACTTANPSYTCVKTEHNCYIKNAPAACPVPSHINSCLNTDGIKTTPTVVGKSGEDDCYDCTYLCDTANGWQTGSESNCPTGWICKYASLTDPYRSKGADCYKKDYCNTTQGYYDTDSACTTANSEYTCIVDATGCYTKNICNTSKGYYATQSLCEQAAANVGYQCAQSAGGCWKKSSTPATCPTSSSTAQCSTESKNGIIATSTKTGTSGTADCLACDYKCNTAAGWKQGTSAANCPDGRVCSDTSINDTARSKTLSCYHDDGCPTDYTYTSETTCKNGGYTCEESAAGSGCWKRNGNQDCPEGYQETACTDAKTGITLIPATPVTVGSRQCYKCEYECNGSLAYKDDSNISICGSKASNGWTFINAVDQGTASCAQCQEKPCPAGTATSKDSCDKYNSLTAAQGSASGSYHGEATCYTCTYSCNVGAGYYSTAAQCEDGGTYTCSQVEDKTGYTCYIRQGDFHCPSGQQSDHCTASATGFKTTETAHTYDGGTCYSCSYACDTANGWQSGSSCPAGKSCPDGTNKITSPVACVKPICPTSHSYTNKTTCETGGYVCAESASGSGCFGRTGNQDCPEGYQEATCTDAKTGITLTSSSTTVGSRQCYKCEYECNGSLNYKDDSNISICGSKGSSGWRFIYAVDQGTASCARCQEKSCPTSYATDLNGCTKYESLTAYLGSPSTTSYHGEASCYSCGYYCNEDKGYYQLQNECEATGGVYDCELGNENGINCYHRISDFHCPEGQQSTFCAPHVGFSVNETSKIYEGNTCYTCSYACDTASGYKNTTAITNCGSSGSKGWEFANQVTNGSLTCATCKAKTCPTGYATSSDKCETTAGSVVNTMKNTSDEENYAGETPCHKCTYSCDESTTFKAQSACEADSKNLGYTCASTPVPTPGGSIPCYTKSSPKSCPAYTGTDYDDDFCLSNLPPYLSLPVSTGTGVYSSGEECLKCVASCDEIYNAFSSLTDCESGGFTCSENNYPKYGVTCYHRTTTCPAGYGEEMCGEDTEWILINTKDTKKFGSTTCYKCEYLPLCTVDHTWQYTSRDSVPTNTGGTFDFEVPDLCNAENGYYATGSNLSSCGSGGAEGWEWTDQKSECGLSCAKCTAKTCPTGSRTINAPRIDCPDAENELIEVSLGGSTGKYSGNDECMQCKATCATDMGQYSTLEACSENGKYSCSERKLTSSYYNLYCYERQENSGCPDGYSRNECGEDTDWVMINTIDTKVVNGETCYKCEYLPQCEVDHTWQYTNPDYETTNTGEKFNYEVPDLCNSENGYLDDTSDTNLKYCGSTGSNGWLWTNHQQTTCAGNTLSCAKCQAKACPSGSATTENQCLASYALKVSLSSSSTGYSGESTCHTCTYTCNNDNNYFSLLAQCTAKFSNCSAIEQNGVTCYTPTDAEQKNCPANFIDSDSLPRIATVFTYSQVIKNPLCNTALGTNCNYCVSITGCKYASEAACIAANGSCTLYTAGTGTGLTCYGPETSTSALSNMTYFNTDVIEKTSTGSENITGITSSGDIENAALFDEQTGEVLSSGHITLIHNSTGTATGIKGIGANQIANRQFAEINIKNNAGGTAIGIHADQGGSVINEGLIKIEGQSGTAIGILGEGANHIVNAESGVIDVEGAKAYGIYVKDGEGSLVENKGIIKALGDEAHGIYIEKNATVDTVLNSGSIYVNGTEKGNAGITLNGADLRNESLLSFSGKANLNALDGRVYLEKGGTIEAQALEGDLTLGISNVLGSNEDTYVAEGALQTEDLANLNLISESALFKAKATADGNTVLERESFDKFTPNASIAKYLTSNYEQGKLVEMYDAIKNQTEAQKARRLIAKDLGYDTMPNFADENFMALKSLNRNIADTILQPSDENYRVVAGADSVSLETKNKAVLSGYDLSATSMYTFGDKRLDNKNRLGLGLSFTKLSSSYDRGGDRDLNIVSLFIPYLHKFTDKLNLASILSFGYGYGDLERGGNKKADINDIFYGFTNELRYSMDLNGFASLEPALYLNAIGYTEDGLDEGSENLALETGRTHNLSIEAGVGLFLKKQVSLEKYGKLGFKIGGAYYRELGSPYDDIKARIKSGNRSWYRMNDYANIYTHDRALIEAMIDYEYKDLSIYAKFNQIIQKNNPKLFDLGIKYKF